MVGVLQRHQHLPGHDVGFADPVAGPVHRPHRDLPAEDLEHLGAGTGGGPATDDLVDQNPVRDPGRIGGGAGVLDAFRPVDRRAQQPPHGLGRGGDGTVAVGGAVHVKGGDVVEGVARRGIVAAEVVPARLGRLTEGHHRVDHGHVEELALAGGPGVQHCGHQAQRGHQPRDEVADQRSGPQRVLGVGPGGGDHPAHGLGDHVVGRPGGVGAGTGPGVAEAADGGVHQAGVAGPAGVPAHPEAVEDSAAQVLHQAVGGLDQLQEHLPVLVGGEVEHDGALVAVAVGETAAVEPFVVLGQERRGEAGQLALRRLDLDDVGPEVGQHHRRVRPGCGMGHVDDADADQRSAGPARLVAHRRNVAAPRIRIAPGTIVAP